MRWSNQVLWLIVVLVCLLLAVPSATQTRPVPLTPDAQRTVDGLIAGAGPWPLISEAPPEPEGYADHICDTPQNLTGSVRIGYHPNDSQTRLSIVWDGGAYGVAFLGSSTSHVFFARVAADGTVLLPARDISSVTTYAHYNPIIAWSGTEYGIASAADISGNTEIYFHRLSSEGAVLTTLRVTTAAGTSNYPSLAWRGGTDTEWAIVWEDSRTTVSDIYLARVDADGTKLGSDIQITNDAGASYRPTLAWSGGTYCGVTWYDTRTTGTDIYFALLGMGGKSGSDIQITSNASYSYEPSIAWTGTCYGIAWYDDRTTAYDLYFTRVTEAGGKLGGDVQITSDAGQSLFPNLAWTGSEFGVAWQDSRDGETEIYFARISAAGAKVGSDMRLTADGTASSKPALAFGTLGYGVLYPATTSLDTLFVGLGCHADTTPPGCPSNLQAVAAGSGAALTWRAGVDTETEVAFHRVYRNNAPLALTTASTYTDPGPAPGAVYEVTAVNANGRESAGCPTVQPVPAGGECGLPIGTDSVIRDQPSQSYYPQMVWAGGSFGVVWSDLRHGNSEVYFARVAPDGTLLGMEVRVTEAAGESYLGSLVWTGTEYGLAWQDQRDGNYEIYFARLAADGTKIGSDVRITNDGASAFTSETPSMVWTGSEYGVAWSDNRSGTYEIYFARISAAGVKIGSDTAITTLDGVQSNAPSLAWLGSEYGLAWTDWRLGPTEIYFTRVSSSGVKQGGDIQVTSGGANSAAPNLVAGSLGYGLVWHNWTGVYRSYFTILSSAGAKQTPETLLSDLPAVRPKLVWTGGEFGVVWSSSTSWDSDLYYAAVSSGGTVGATRKITSDPGGDFSGVLASGEKGLGLIFLRAVSPTHYLVVFRPLGCGAADTTPPSCPASPEEISRTPTTVTLGWGPSVDAESDLGVYRVYRDAALVGTTAGTTWTDSAFDPVAGYVYWITATNAAGLESAGCASVNTADTVPPSCPSDLRVTAKTTTTLTLSWGASADNLTGVAGYRVYKNYALSTTTTSLTWTDSAYSASAGALYQVVALDGAGNESQGCASVDTKDTTPPTCPSGLRVTARTPTLFQFWWNASQDAESGVTSYRVYKNSSLVGTVTALNYGDGGFNPAAGSLYYVVALNGAGLESQNCEVLDSSDHVAPTCAENLLASGVTASQVTLNWLPAQDALSGLKQYRLYRDDVELATVAAGTTTYTDATLAAGTAYNFAVKSEDYAGNLSPLCTTSSVWISTAPILLFLTKDMDGVHADLDWNDVGINPYVVYRSTSPQTAGELKRAPLSETQDAVLKDGVTLWFYYIQQRE